MDVEKLLGKLLHEATGSGSSNFKKYAKGSKKKYKKKYKKKKYYADRSGSHGKTSLKNSLISNLTGQLTSGKGLLTAVGLGVGAYEIYRSTRKTQQQPTGTAAYQQPYQQPYHQQSVSPGRPSVPPPPQPPAQQQYNYSGTPPAAGSPTMQQPRQTRTAPVPQDTNLDDQELARRLIRVMVGAAHADGILDAEEEKIILDRLRSVDLSQEEKMFLLEELHHPRSIAELTKGINDARLGQAMYAVAVSTIEVNTASERQWLDDLGSALGLSPEICGFIEESH